MNIECINSKNETFMAHRIKNVVQYKCGVCMGGDIFVDPGKKMILNLKDNKCNECESTIRTA